MKVAFRADASLAVGSGHVMRCLTLADELAGNGAATHFIVRDLPGNLVDLIEARGHAYTVLPAPTAADAADADGPAHGAWLGVSRRKDAAATLDALSSWGGADWLVVDHYALDASWERLVRQHCEAVMAIDDLADRPHDCDLLLDQGLYDDPAARYDARLPTACRCLFGPHYALLRPQFAEERLNLRRRDDRVQRLLVFFGGADLGNDTGKVLDALDLIHHRDFAIDVVVGGSNPHGAEIEMRCRKMGIAFHRQTETMATLTAAADLAVGAGGVANWERCCLGLPSLTWAVADNQKSGLERLARDGAIFCPDPDSVANPEAVAHHLFSLLRNASLRYALSIRAATLCDGFGARRVVAAMMAGRIRVRSAEMSDRDTILQWRNHPLVRRYSLNPQPIESDAHREWFDRTLACRDRALLIGEDAAGAAVGVVRYDFTAAVAEVSIYLAPDRFGKGWGDKLLHAAETWLRAHHPEISSVIARVVCDNEVSVRLFRRGGYLAEQFLFRKELTP